MLNPRNYPDTIQSAESCRPLRRGVKMLTFNRDGEPFTHAIRGGDGLVVACHASWVGPRCQGVYDPIILIAVIAYRVPPRLDQSDAGRSLDESPRKT